MIKRDNLISVDNLPLIELHKIFITSLGGSVLETSDVSQRPLELDLIPPLPHKIRVYIYNLTHPPGGRTLGEHKIQIILPEHKQNKRAEFDNSGGRIVILAGYEPENRIFVLWDAGLYVNNPFSRNVQVKPEAVYEAFAGKISLQERNIRGQGKEIVVTCPRKKLPEALYLRMELTRKRLLGNIDYA
jgi:hypothetical protein